MQKIIIAMLIFFSCSLCVYATESRAEKDAKDYLDFKAMLMANLKYIGESDDDEYYSLPYSTIYDFFKKRNVNFAYLTKSNFSYLLLMMQFLDEENEEFYPLLKYVLDNGGASTITAKYFGRTAINFVEETSLHDKSYNNMKEARLALEMSDKQIRLARFLIQHCNDNKYKMLSKTFWLDASAEDIISQVGVGSYGRRETVCVDDAYDMLNILDFVIRYGTDEQVMLMLERYDQTSLFRADDYGRTYLMKAAKYRGLAAVKTLVELNRRVYDLYDDFFPEFITMDGTKTVDIVNNYKTALNYAELCEENGVLECKMDVRRYLLGRMKNPTQKLLSHTYWMLATPEELKRDIAAGADLKMHRGGIVTPVKYAAVAAKDYELLEILLEAGAEKVFGCDSGMSVDTHVKLFRPYGDNDKMYKFLKDHGVVDIECQLSDYLDTKNPDEK